MSITDQMTVIKGLSVFALMMMLNACTEKNASGGIGGSGFQVELTSDTSALILEDEGGAPLSITKAEVYVRDIELDLPDDLSCEDLTGTLTEATCSSDEKVVISGPRVINLITGTSRPSLSGVVIPAGLYKRVDIRLDDGKVNEGLIMSGDPLDDRTLVVEADLDTLEVTTRLSLMLKFNEDLRIEDPEGVYVEDGEALLTQLNVAQWFEDIDLASCLSDREVERDDGVLIIDDDEQIEGVCAGIENMIKRHIKESGQLDKRAR